MTIPMGEMALPTGVQTGIALEGITRAIQEIVLIPGIHRRGIRQVGLGLNLGGVECSARCIKIVLGKRLN